MRSTIQKFISEEYFTLEYLNSRIADIKTYCSEITNMPPSITINILKGKLNLKISAAEMFNLVRYFGLIIGDKITEGDKYWKMYKLLRQILDIISSPRIVRSDAKTLTNLIQDLNQNYINLIGALKPKFHHLVHYPRVLLQNELINFWCMRYESRHRELKTNAQSSS